LDPGPQARLFWDEGLGKKIKRHCETGFFVILNEVKDLNSLKM
jgi:hypothetical protein